MPSDVKKPENILHHRLRMQDKLFVVDRQTSSGTNTHTLTVHVLHRRVPLLQATAEVGQVKSGDSYLHSNKEKTK